MVSFFSSVDPIFYLHHGNLDRLWDVWTRRQTALGRPTLPQGADLATWSNEQFLFFSNEKGQPVSKIKAGDYTTISAFDYDYSPGSSEDEHVPAAALKAGTSPDAAPQVTEITLNLAHSDQGRRFRVLVSPGGGAAPVAAGAITVFGVPHHGPTTFTVPLPENVPLDIRVVPIGPALGPAAARAVATPPQVTAIQVRTN